MSDRRYWGTTPAADRPTVFRGLVVRVEEDSQGWWLKESYLRSHTYGVTVPPYHPCGNPSCKNGGVDLWSVKAGAIIPH